MEVRGYTYLVHLFTSKHLIGAPIHVKIDLVALDQLF
jgi:hypothetical protein